MQNNIRKLRVENDMSQTQLAEKLGVTRGAVSQWELGTTLPRMGMVQRIAGVFHVKVSEVIGQNEPTGDLSYDEVRLLDIFRQLNARGRERLIEDAMSMLMSGMYAPAKNREVSA